MNLRNNIILDGDESIDEDNETNNRRGNQEVRVVAQPCKVHRHFLPKVHPASTQKVQELGTALKAGQPTQGTELIAHG